MKISAFIAFAEFEGICSWSVIGIEDISKVKYVTQGTFIDANPEHRDLHQESITHERLTHYKYLIGAVAARHLFHRYDVVSIYINDSGASKFFRQILPYYKNNDFKEVRIDENSDEYEIMPVPDQDLMMAAATQAYTEEPCTSIVYVYGKITKYDSGSNVKKRRVMQEAYDNCIITLRDKYRELFPKLFLYKNIS